MNQLEKVSFADSNTAFYVNSGEHRGKHLAKIGGISQPAVTGFWRRAVRQWKPTILLDIGVNYGEIIFSTTYPDHALIIGIEANPQLAPIIEKSRQEHPNRGQIRMIYALASDCETEGQNFYVDKYWSGTSSAVPNVNQHLFEVHKVNSIKVDSLFLNRPLADERLLFKIDVEGYEGHALAGMSRLVSECGSVLGNIEFNNSFLEKAGVRIEEFFAFLNVHFHVYIHTKGDSFITLNRLNMQSLQSFFKREDIDTHLLLASKNEDVRQLGFHITPVDL
ncbi:FkbM family methyltransferase [Paenibacillus doosanensis]|uniref:FkbM family methyltransferase n=1 Tax=Paenibacillus doosanensis TaxID=1229154 RepID=UPI00217F4BDC|nr:FkbM family methyltransferase [Paenibacillus doosanensis]MCS7458845.1 FkbM family methyltransferase [Paenibacillus doosanensis]